MSAGVLAMGALLLCCSAHLLIALLGVSGLTALTGLFGKLPFIVMGIAALLLAGGLWRRRKAAREDAAACRQVQAKDR